MSLYYVDLRPIRRSHNENAVAYAAYMEDRPLKDERTGIVYDEYGIEDTDKSKTTICLGSRLPNRQTVDTQKLWNLAEATEKRKDSQTATKLVLALQIENDTETHKKHVEKIRRYIESKFEVATTAVIHYEHEENPHAHILFTTRKVTKNMVFENKLRIFESKDKGPRELRLLRYVWEKICNKDLAPESQIDRRSYQRQGIELTPQIHMGSDELRRMEEGHTSKRIERYKAIEKIRETEIENINQNQDLGKP